MKRMSEVFELPVVLTTAQESIGATSNKVERVNLAAHAINHVDALADALEALTSDIESNNNPRYTYECAIAALAAYRGEA
jgi:hypothetical protein